MSSNLNLTTEMAIVRSRRSTRSEFASNALISSDDTKFPQRARFRQIFAVLDKGEGAIISIEELETIQDLRLTELEGRSIK